MTRKSKHRIISPCYGQGNLGPGGVRGGRSPARLAQGWGSPPLTVLQPNTPSEASPPDNVRPRIVSHLSDTLTSSGN